MVENNETFTLAEFQRLTWNGLNDNSFYRGNDGLIYRRVSASLNGDFNVENTSIDTGGYIGKASGTNADFTTAYASAVTITLSGFPANVSALVGDDIVSVIQVTNTGAVSNVYHKQDEGVTFSITANVLTVGATTTPTFGATDTFIIYTNVPRPTDSSPEVSGSSSGVMIGSEIGSYSFDASAKEVTITGIRTLLLEEILQIVNVTDNIVIYNSGVAGKGGSISSNVITLDFDTTSMSDTDDLQIIVQYNNSQDFDLAAQKNIVQNPLWSRYTSPEQLVTASDIGAADGVYIDQGAEIDCRGYNTFGIFVKFTVSDSTTNTLKFLVKHESGGAEEFVFETPLVKTLGDANINVYYEFDVNNGTPYIQIQSAAADVDTGGGTIGTLEINVVKGWK